MLVYMLAHKKVTARDLADRFEISERTVYRYMDDLSLAGVPVYSQKGASGGFCIAETYKLPALYFTQKEFSALSGLINSFKDLPKSSELYSVLEKITAQKKDNSALSVHSSTFFIDAEGWKMNESFSTKLSAFTKAVEDATLLEIGYKNSDGKESTRKIEPHAIALIGGLWYVYAYCRLRDEFRLFKINRIKYAAACGTFEKREFDIKVLPVTAWSGDIDKDRVLLEISPAARQEVEDWLGLESVYDNKGKIYAEATLPINEHLVFELLKFGDRIKVISPEALKTRIKDHVNSVLKLYS